MAWLLSRLWSACSGHQWPCPQLGADVTAPDSWAHWEPQMPVPRQTLVARWGQEVRAGGAAIPFLCFPNRPRRAEPSVQVCSAIIVPVMVSRCCGLTGLGLGQAASPPSPTSHKPPPCHPCQYCIMLLDQPASLRPTPSSLQPAQLLGQGTQAAFLALTLNFLWHKEVACLL